ncbi:MAG: flavodoxin-dependent (E)-4-hydroxy-3-methylbut-2-enyl-diphosphate synthase [Candidatus Omnitrophica bacterium]|nr:flavodoxin-dependent (E)-4-hydroxy-3-methylbut-2-enyl-diphosphate synthase [Candidatus Omnitrophota bacterium]
MKRRKTRQVKIGSLSIGSKSPVVIQTMTNTPTADQSRTFHQVVELIESGAEAVRLTVNSEAAAVATGKIIGQLRRAGYPQPIIGDFHYNGHVLLSRFPECAQQLDKYRINPGNVGHGSGHQEHFAQIISIAKKWNKPVRIGINGGSLDQDLLAKLIQANSRRKKPLADKEVFYKCAIASALDSAALAQKYGLAANKIIISIKMSNVQDLLAVNAQLAKKCDYPLHLGLTEAGSDIEGIIASTSALAILLQQGIGDTIRISLTPQPGMPRTREVEVCKVLLQSLGMRSYSPTVISCPGCGRTSSDDYQDLAAQIKQHIKNHLKQWKERYIGIEGLKIAVMGCVVNGPGESRHADIGISLAGEKNGKIGAVYQQGHYLVTLKGASIKKDFFKLLESFIRKNYSAR